MVVVVEPEVAAAAAVGTVVVDTAEGADLLHLITAEDGTDHDPDLIHQVCSFLKDLF